MDWEDTIVGPATFSGAGARMILRLSGPAAHSVVASTLSGAWPLPWKHTVQPVTVRIPGWNREVAAELYTWPAGRSYTGQPAIELHLPPCSPLATALQSEWTQRGVRLAKPGEFTLRAFIAGKLDLAEAEGVLGLIHADTIDELREAIDQRAGGISRPVAELRSELLNLLADLEAGLDFVDEDITFISAEQLETRLQAANRQLQSLLEDLQSRSLEAHPPRIVLVGPPNAGKSSLLNLLAGESTAIVSPMAGTTRDVVNCQLKLGDRLVEWVDTAGWEDPEGEIMQQAADLRATIVRGADLVIWCVPADADADADLQPTNIKTEAPAPAWLDGVPLLRLQTKSDLRPGVPSFTEIAVSIFDPQSIEVFKMAVAEKLDQAGAKGFRSISERCRTGLALATDSLRHAHDLSAQDAGQEYVAVAVREALDHLGEIVGAVYTNDLLDRIFSRFCIGK